MKVNSKLDTGRVTAVGLSVYGLSQLVSFREGPNHILTKFRRWAGVEDTDENNEPKSSLGKLVSCPACIGFWIAMPLSLLAKRPSQFGDFILSALGAYGIHAFLHARGYKA